MQDIIFRDQARSLGLKRFFTGIQCGYGHVCERRVSSGGCWECLTNSEKRSQAKHRKALNERQQIYREKNRELVLELARQRYRRNKQEILKKKREAYLADAILTKAVREILAGDIQARASKRDRKQQWDREYSMKYSKSAKRRAWLWANADRVRMITNKASHKMRAEARANREIIQQLEKTT
jgi:hypothetical protein